MRDFTITKLERHPLEGYWQARVTADGNTIEVHRKHGSWIGERRIAPRSQTMQRFHVLPAVAAVLQEKVRRRERRGE